MATSSATPPTLGSYELMGTRVQKIINGQQAQKTRSALIFKLPDENDNDWGQLLEEIAENDNVTLAHRDDGGVQLFWTVPKED